MGFTMTAPEREALVKELRGEAARIAEYAAQNGWDGRAAPLLNKAAAAIEALSHAPAVTVTEERVTRAAKTLSNYTVSDRYPGSERDAVLEEAAALAEAWSPFVKEKWRAGEMNHAEFAANHGAALTIARKIRALKSTTPQTGSQE